MSPDEDLRPIYVTTEPYAVLHCADCVDWERDVDGTALPEVTAAAREHLADPEHERARQELRRVDE